MGGKTAARVDFYILPDARPGGRERLACGVAEKAWRHGYRVYVRAADSSEAARLDTLMWTFRDGSFVPHAMTATADARDPIVIGSSDDPPPSGCDMLVNLDPGQPPAMEEWSRIAELSNQQDEHIQAAREKFRWYRSQGIEPGTIRL